MRKLTTKEFIERAIKVHGNKYDYSKVEYVNATKSIKIICKEHGEFIQLPFNHLQGKGCPICRYINSSNKNKMTLEEFIERAIKVHGNKYDYSKVEYVNNRTKVCIICHEHGEFWQRPDDHIIKKHGCPKCSGNKKRTLESFINDANKKHNYFFNYNKSVYNGIHNKLIITCPIHGDFLQAPNDHLRGQGCPLCKQSKLENEIMLLLKENNIKYITQYRYDDSNLKYRLDFYLPDYKIGIECQGEQHFKKVDFANKGEEWSEKLYINNMKNDLYKQKKCTEKKIKLIYFTKQSLIKEIKNVNHFLNEELYSNNIFTNKKILLKEIKAVSFDDI